MDCIVLVKQVPDVSNIPEDAWDRERGTLRRAMLDSILNPLDLHALTFATRLAEGDANARLVFLSMGPPQARDVLVDCLSRVPGEGILLTDTPSPGRIPAPPPTRWPVRSGGSSASCSAVAATTSSSAACSPSTATRPRSRRRSPRSWGSTTSPTPRALETEPELRIRRIGPEGHRGRPAAPLAGPGDRHRLHGSRSTARSSGRVGARTCRIHEWDADVRGADPRRIGLKGSWTQVYRLFSPSEDRAKTCEYVRDPAELVAQIAARYRQAAPGAEVGADDGYELGGPPSRPTTASSGSSPSARATGSAPSRSSCSARPASWPTASASGSARSCRAPIRATARPS